MVHKATKCWNISKILICILIGFLIFYWFDGSKMYVFSIGIVASKINLRYWFCGHQNQYNDSNQWDAQGTNGNTALDCRERQAMLFDHGAIFLWDRLVFQGCLSQGCRNPWRMLSQIVTLTSGTSALSIGLAGGRCSLRIGAVLQGQPCHCCEKLFMVFSAAPSPRPVPPQFLICVKTQLILSTF